MSRIDTKYNLVTFEDFPILKRALHYFTNWPSRNSSENKHLSLIFNGKSLASIGYNKKKTHTIFKSLGLILPDDYYTIHSEVDAILNLLRILRTKNLSKFPKNLVMVNFRSKFRLSAPCCNCLTLLELLNFKEVYFSAGKYSNKYLFGRIDIGELDG